MFINLIQLIIRDLYISTAGILRHCDHTIAKNSAKIMFDQLSELKDEEY